VLTTQEKALKFSKEEKFPRTIAVLLFGIPLPVNNRILGTKCSKTLTLEVAIMYLPRDLSAKTEVLGSRGL
jgi:hypothetical protein